MTSGNIVSYADNTNVYPSMQICMLEQDAIIKRTLEEDKKHKMIQFIIPSCLDFVPKRKA